MAHFFDDECQCDICKIGREAYIKKEKEILDRVGWLIHYILGDPLFPNQTNIHTHGLPDKYNHPDIQICLHISAEMATGIIHSIISNIQNGFKYEAGQSYDNIFKNYDIQVVERMEGERHLLRFLLPDKKNTLDTPPYCYQSI